MAPPHHGGGLTSTAEGALGIDVKRVERMRGRHEQPVAVAAAEADVGAALGQRDVADRLALWAEYANAVELLRHAPAAPEVPVNVTANAVGRSLWPAVDQDLAVGEFVAVPHHVKHQDAARLGARLHDVKLFLVRRKA